MFTEQVLKRVGVAVWIGMAIVMAAHAQTNEVPDAEAILRRAYLAVVQAELARAEQHVPDAVAEYKTALSLYGRLQGDYPGWHADMVGYRVADCNNMLAELEPLGGVQAVPLGDATTNRQARLELLVQELKSAKGWLMQGGDGLAGRQMLLERERDRIRDERDQAVKQAQVASRQVGRLEARLRRFEQGGGASRTNAFVLLPAAIRADAQRYMQDGQCDKAMMLLREGFEAMPERQDFEVLAAVAACRAGRFNVAVGILKPYDTRTSVNADALLTLGTAWMGMGRIGEARVATEKVLQINPKSGEAHYNMAQIFLTLKPADPVAAEKHYRQALALGMEADPDFENSLRMACIVARLKKRTEK